MTTAKPRSAALAERAAVKLKRRVKAVVGRDTFIRPTRLLPVEQHGVGYGAWHVWAEPLDSRSIVYAVGVGADVTFDLSLIRRFGLEVDAFDPTPRCVEWIARQKLPPQFRFHAVGVAGYDGTAVFRPPPDPTHVSYALAPEECEGAIEAPVRRLRTLAAANGHVAIDLLKLDIEGAEYAVIEDFCEAGPDVRQLLVEFHHGRFGVSAHSTKMSVATLAAAGFDLFHVSRTGTEYAFIHRSSAGQRDGRPS